jgi:GT2 family glycosyltransferase
MKKEPIITISLLTWNGERYLPWLLKSLKAQTFTNWRLLVLDNNSSDRSLDIVQEEIPQAKIIQQKKNIGFDKGHNMLINWSNSEYVLVLNQDIILDKDYLSKLVTFMDVNKKVASCAGKIMYWDFSEGLKSKIIDSFGIKIDRKRSAIDIGQGKQDYKVGNREVFGLSAAATLYRRQALIDVAFTHGSSNLEYFDEDYFAYKEDIDLAWRFRLWDWENWMVSSTKAYHHRTVSSNGSLRAKRKLRATANRLSYRNHLMTTYKNSFLRNYFKDYFYIKFYEFKKIIYLLIFERSTLRGLKEFIKFVPRLNKKRKHIKKYRRVKADDIYRWFA